MSKLTSEQKDALVRRGNDIGLEATLAHECISEAQQDIMLMLQKQVGVSRIVHMNLSKNAPKRPTRDYESAMQKLEDLFEYIRETGDIDSYKALRDVQLIKKASSVNDNRNRVKEYAEEELISIGTTKTRRDLLITAYMQYFDSYAPTKKDYDILNGFTLKEHEIHGITDEELEEANQDEGHYSPRPQRDF